MTCPTCLRPQATEADAKTWAASPDGTDTPDGWPDPDGSHLCWREIADGDCEPPEWWVAVTPLDVRGLRASNAELHARLSELLTIFAGTQSIPQPTDPASVEEIRAICRKAVAMRRAAWRDGEPPANALVLRERPDGALQAVYTVLDAGRVCILRSSGDVVLWGTARWCPIVRPT